MPPAPHLEQLQRDENFPKSTDLGTCTQAIVHYVS